MSKLKTLIRLFKNRERLGKAIALNYSETSVSHCMSDKSYLQLQYFLCIGKRLDLKKPKTFTEKLQWLKLYNRDPMYCILVDKYDVKQYIAEKIGEEYIIPNLGIWDCVDEIDFDALPNSFVIKCTHDSGSTIICRDKSTFDVHAAKQKLKEGLSTNLFWYGREWPYKNVKPRIISEEYMVDSTTKELRDYKFFCFNGRCRCMKVDFDRFVEHRANYYDPDGNLLHFGEIACPPDEKRNIVLPQNMKKKIALAEELSADVPFMRVDFYEVDGRIYFGEITFFPASGFGAFEPDCADEMLGSWLELSERGKK